MITAIGDNDSKVVQSMQGKTTTGPMLFAKLSYKQLDYQKPGTYTAWLTYRKEPQVSQYGNTDWWEANAEGLRIGGDYVIDKNLSLNAYYTLARDIDSHEKRNGARIELDAFF